MLAVLVLFLLAGEAVCASVFQRLRIPGRLLGRFGCKRLLSEAKTLGHQTFGTLKEPPIEIVTKVYFAVAGYVIDGDSEKLPTCKRIIEIFGDKLLNDNFNPPIPFIAVTHDRYELLEHWIKCKLPLDFIDGNGLSIWHYYYGDSSLALTRLLIDHGPPCGNPQFKGSRVVHHFDADVVLPHFFAGNFEIIDMLVEMGASLDSLHLLASVDVKYDPTKPASVYAGNIAEFLYKNGLCPDYTEYKLSPWFPIFQ